MEPAQPPLPTAWNFPFQPEAGSQTSIWMSESLVGFSVAATRQNVGSSWYWRAAAAGAPGKLSSPAGMDRASVIVASGSASADRLSHDAATAAVGARTAASSRNQPLFFIASLLCQNPYILSDNRGEVRRAATAPRRSRLGCACQFSVTYRAPTVGERLPASAPQLQFQRVD